MMKTRRGVRTTSVAWVCAVVLACAGCGGAPQASKSPSYSADAAATSDAVAASDGVRTSSDTGPTSVGTTPRLVFPGADIDQRVVPGGLSDKGTISPPRDTVMWFDGYGRVAPGQVGISLIAAHVKYGDDDDAFAELDQANVGDEFALVGPDDVTTQWRVSAVDVLDKGELQDDERVWGRQKDEPRLALVTCDSSLGFRDDGHRVANRVVLAEPAG